MEEFAFEHFAVHLVLVFAIKHEEGIQHVVHPSGLEGVVDHPPDTHHPMSPPVLHEGCHQSVGNMQSLFMNITPRPEMQCILAWASFSTLLRWYITSYLHSPRRSSTPVQPWRGLTLSCHCR